MKLFIWQDVLTDHTSGMITALAPDLETALAAAREHCGSDVSAEMGRALPTTVDLDGAVVPIVWYVKGGG